MAGDHDVSVFRFLCFWAGIAVFGLLGCLWMFFLAGMAVDGARGALEILWGLFEITVVVGAVGTLLVWLGKR